MRFIYWLTKPQKFADCEICHLWSPNVISELEIEWKRNQIRNFQGGSKDLNMVLFAKPMNIVKIAAGECIGSSKFLSGLRKNQGLPMFSSVQKSPYKGIAKHCSPAGLRGLEAKEIRYLAKGWLVHLLPLLTTYYWFVWVKNLPKGKLYYVTEKTFYPGWKKLQYKSTD